MWQAESSRIVSIFIFLLSLLLKKRPFHLQFLDVRMQKRLNFTNPMRKSISIFSNLRLCVYARMEWRILNVYFRTRIVSPFIIRRQTGPKEMLLTAVIFIFLNVIQNLLCGLAHGEPHPSQSSHHRVLHQKLQSSTLDCALLLFNFTTQT